MNIISALSIPPDITDKALALYIRLFRVGFSDSYFFRLLVILCLIDTNKFNSCKIMVRTISDENIKVELLQQRTWLCSNFFPVYCLIFVRWSGGVWVTISSPKCTHQNQGPETFYHKAMPFKLDIFTHYEAILRHETAVDCHKFIHNFMGMRTYSVQRRGLRTVRSRIIFRFTQICICNSRVKVNKDTPLR